MTVLTETIHPGEWLISDEGTRSRDALVVTVPAQTVIRTGTVLGKITASGKWVPSLNAAADGSQVAAAVLLYDIPAQAAGDVKATAITREAEVWGAMLNGGTALESGVAAELAAQQIIVRN